MEQTKRGRRTTQRAFAQEYKDEVVAWFLASGKTIAEVAAELNLSASTVRRWVERAAADVAPTSGTGTGDASSGNGVVEAAGASVDPVAAEVEPGASDPVRALDAPNWWMTWGPSETIDKFGSGAELSSDAESESGPGANPDPVDEMSVSHPDGEADNALTTDTAPEQCQLLVRVSGGDDLPATPLPVASHDPGATEARSVEPPTVHETGIRFRPSSPAHGLDWVEATGRTVAQAREAALDRLGVDDADAEVEVLSSKRLPRRLVRVRARIRANDNLERCQ